MIEEKKSENTEFNRDWYICNMRRGTGSNASFIYAELRDGNRQLFIAADLEFIVNRINAMLPIQN
jgi:hypothetical protein